MSMVRRLPALLLVVGLPVGAQPVGVREIDGAPFPSSLVRDARGATVAWVQNAQGVRNIWLARSPEWRARRLTAFSTDDGQELSQLAFASDGRTLWFVRGSGPNRAGESPNPTSDPMGAEQAIWRVGTGDSSVAVRVTDGSAPTPAPVGSLVAFVRRGQVFAYDGAGAAVVEKPLFRMRGSAGGLAWSPDAGQLAFLSQRGTHAFVGVYGIGSARLRWMAPSTDGDLAPVWSPDGTRLAFVRIPYERRRMIFRAQRTAQPWQVMVADVAAGTARAVFTATPGSGSAYWAMQSPTQVLWTADDRLVFPWERDGFLHLYSMPSSGGTPVQLDRGPHEVEDVTLGADGRTIVFNSNQGDRDRRHLWRVPADGGTAAERLTPGDGIEWAPTPLADGRVAFLASDARRPAHAVLLEGTTRRPLAPETMPTGYPQDRLVAPTAVTFTANDGVETYGQLFLPPSGAVRTGAKARAIIFLHGGSRRQMLLGWNYGSYYHHAYAMNQALAQRGWAVLSLNYRSGIGYGRDFREAIEYGAGGGREYRDVVAAAQWLRKRADVDSTKVALWGGSYGGYLTAQGLSRNPELFAAGVDVHGVHDWNVGIATFLPDYNPLEDPVAARVAFESSPLSTVSRWRDPVLLVHGDDDRNVRFIETLSLIEKLRGQGVPVEQLVLPDEIHGFLRHESWMRVFESALEFLERRVAP
jgi:dipeptidyl aminopeptidase/acylaminoacyl peptidase